MAWRPVLLAVLLAGVAAMAAPAHAQTVRYELTADSRVTTFCHGCAPGAQESQPLTGSFELSVLPGATYGIAAVTGIAWQSGAQTISGSGFVQRFPDGRLAMVLDTRLNGVPVLLTSSRRQPSSPEAIHVRLTSAKGERSGFAIALVAVPARSDVADSDGDGLGDQTDTCPATPNVDQLDDDGDGVGNACDQCAETAGASPVLASGCAIEQACPCAGPSADAEWSDQRAYVQCVARALKSMRQLGLLGKSEIRRRLQDAVRSGCGRRILAMG